MNASEQGRATVPVANTPPRRAADPMQRYTDLGKTPEGLRHFSQKMLAYNSQYGGGYAMHVLESAADEIERLNLEIRQLQESVNADRQPFFPTLANP